VARGFFFVALAALVGAVVAVPLVDAVFGKLGLP